MLTHRCHPITHRRRTSALPPVWAEFALDIVLSPTRADEVIGDLRERFPTRLERYGRGKAALWYSLHAVGVIVAESIAVATRLGKSGMEGATWTVRQITETVTLATENR